MKAKHSILKSNKFPLMIFFISRLNAQAFGHFLFVSSLLSKQAALRAIYIQLAIGIYIYVKLY